MSRCAWMLSGLLLACAAQARAAVPEVPAFRTLGVAAGLPSGSVNAIVQDRAGYLWIATADGLARHDGVGFRVWRHDPADPASLAGNNVQALHVDARDRIWVATEGGGLDMLTADRKGFRHFTRATHPAIGSDDTWAIASRGDTLWFGTWGGGLHRMDATGRITRYMPRAGDARSLPAATVVALAFDAQGSLWIGTTAGLARWTGHDFARVPLPGSRPSSLVYFLAADGPALWVGTADGLHRRLPGGAWQDPAWTRRFARPRAALALVRDRHGEVWVGSQQGLWRAQAGGMLRPVASGQAGRGAASAALLLDRDGGLWAGVPGAGLGYLRPAWRAMAQWPRANATDRTAFRSVAAASAGGVWLAAAQGAPRRLDAAGGVHPMPAAVRRALARDHLRALAESSGGVLWAGSHDRLLRISAGGSLDAWPVGGRDGPRGPIDLLRTAPDGSVWLSCAGSGVQQRDRRGRLLRDWPAGTHGLGEADIESLRFTPDGAAWIAGAGGVARLRPAGAGFEPVAAMGRERAYALAFDGADLAWVARGTGLERYRHGRGGWTREAVVGARQGLPAVEAAGLAVDARHRVWLSSTRGLFRWDPATRQTRRFDVQDGLRSQEFRAHALALGGDGVLAAIDSAGDVVLVDTRATPAPPLRRQLQVAGVAVRTSGHWRDIPATPLVLGPGARELRVQVRLLAYANPGAIRYESRLEGRDGEWWTMDGGERVIAGLRPGDHVLRLRATDAAGNRTPEQRLRWRVLPPWWRAPRALVGWALMACVLLALFAATVRARLRARRRMQRLEQGRALAEQASREKSRFLADLGHEVRTPMTGVLGMSELLLDGRLEAPQRRQVEAIRGAGEHLLRLLDDALDLARAEAGRLVVEAEPLDLRALVAEVSALQAPLARARGLRFAATVSADVPASVRGDALRIRQVLLNLLANAVKFTSRGEVGLAVRALPGGGVRCVVHDTGPGLDEALQARLFRRFERGADSGPAGAPAGFGLGLAISRELVLAMGGEIRAQCAPGGGARFVVDLPLAADQSRAEPACTASTSAATWSGDMSGDMPWPRLNTCPSREPPLPAA